MIQNMLFRFKGDRNYVHGTDLFNGLVTHFGTCSLKNIRFSIHSFIAVLGCRLSVVDVDEQLEPAEVSCVLEADGHEYALSIQADPELDAPLERYDYDETAITSLCVLGEDALTLEGESPHSFIETIVSMNKHMHQQLFPEAKGKWIFTKLELDAYEDVRNQLRLHLKHNFSFKLTKTEILADGVSLGHIYFSLVKS